MSKLTFLFLLTLFSNLAKSQNIYSALHLNQDREYKTVKPQKILETNIFYNPGGKQIDKNLKTFDNTGMLLLEERYDEKGGLKARLAYTNDTTNRIILSRVFERWTHIGYLKETAYYIYDSNKFLIGTTDKDANDNILRQTILLCNEKGHPVELSLLDGNGNSFGKEKAVYLYDKNKVVTSVVSNEETILSSDTIKINFQNANLFPGEGETYNSSGDLTTWISKNPNGTKTIFEEEYTYDSFGNCTENKIYKVTIKKNGKRKKGIDRIFKKEYRY